MDHWFPVARSEELADRHVAWARLMLQDVALWRTDSGNVNAWEDRCPHRGVRLTIGTNTGTELVCQYHGWRFADSTGRCRFIPAHPQQRPAAAVRATTYAVAELHGFVWVNLNPHASAPDTTTLPSGPALTLRSLFTEASVPAVAEGLLRHYPGCAGVKATVTVSDRYTLTVVIEGGQPVLTFLLQPVSPAQTVIHGILHAQPAPGERLAVLRHHNHVLTMFRRVVENHDAARL